MQICTLKLPTDRLDMIPWGLWKRLKKCIPELSSWCAEGEGLPICFHRPISQAWWAEAKCPTPPFTPAGAWSRDTPRGGVRRHPGVGLKWGAVPFYLLKAGGSWVQLVPSAVAGTGGGAENIWNHVPVSITFPFYRYGNWVSLRESPRPPGQ